LHYLIVAWKKNYFIFPAQPKHGNSTFNEKMCRAACTAQAPTLVQISNVTRFCCMVVEQICASCPHCCQNVGLQLKNESCKS
jgi:hypothetical protein